ncbi:MAG TPA: protein kinase [Myxococcaceae bacterium]|jgi:serine/threonine-protein kinase
MSAPYRLIGKIEASDLADLYKAFHEPTGDVVVKLFHPKTSDASYARALAETSRVLNPLHHAGIVHYVDVGFVNKQLAVVRENVDGYTLGTALQRLNTKEVLLPAPIALFLVVQLLETVQKAHEANVIHGAITPGNLLLSREGLPHICDFGALKALNAVPELKASFANRGRSAYRAPEVTRGEEPTAQSDIYSLGAIAYELLTLREAIVTGGGVSTRSGGLPPPSRIDRRINSRLDPLILRALDPFPNRRFRSAGEFAGQLRNFLAANGGMPVPEDLRRFVRDLVPNEVSLSTLGPPAFPEAFALSAVSGAEIAHLHAEAPEVSVVARPSFSRSVSEEEFSSAATQEAMPAFLDYKPEPVPEPTQLAAPEPVPEPTKVVPPSEEPTKVAPPQSASAPGEAEPTRAGPLDQLWDAPPGAAPPKPRKPAGPMMGTPGPKEGTFVGRNPRLKWVEDTSEEKTSIAEDLKEPAPPPPKPAPAARAAAAPAPEPRRPLPSLVRAPPQQESAASPPTRDRPEIPMPPPTSDSLAAGGTGRRLFTEERNLRAYAQRKRQALGLAAGIAVVAVIAFALAIWQLAGESQPPPEPPKMDPRAEAIAGAVDQYEAEPSKPKPSAEEPPRPDPNSAFLTLRTNVPARVIIDGNAINRRTPLNKYPVKAGTRRIVLEAVGTKERIEFEVRLERGKQQVHELKFESTPRR